MKAFYLGAVLLVASGTVWSQTVPSCGFGTLASYISLGSTGCQIDDKIFYGFAYSGGAGVLTAGEVSVTPITTPGNPGVQFGAFWNVAAGVTGDARIFFDVAVLRGGQPIEDDSLGLGGVSNLSGGAKIDVTEGVCLGQALNASNVCTGPSQNPVLEVKAPNATNTFFLDVNFGGPTYTLLGISKDIGLFGGSAADGSGASLSIITQQFSEVPVPEPLSIMLFGSCLLAVAPLLKRRLQ
jgi:hypothetical protein